MANIAWESKSPARLWSDLCRASPSVTSARALLPDGSLISSSWSQRDVVGARKRTFSQSFVRNPGADCDDGAYVATPPTESPACVEYISPSGRHVLRFTQKNGVSGPTEVEVWSLDARSAGGTCLEAVWTVEPTVHRTVFSDEWFGGVAWSPDETMFVYVADRPITDDENARAAGLARGKFAKSAPDADSWMDGLRSKFAETSRDVLGENYIHQRSPALFFADVRQAQTCAMCKPVEDEPDFEGKDIFGDPQWSPDGKWLAVTRRPTALTEPSIEADGISDKPYDLGVRYCYNRYSAIEIFRAPASLDEAEDALRSMVPVANHREVADFCCSSPRFSPDSRVLIYISAPRKDFGRAKSTVLPHNCAKILRAVVVSDDSTDPVTSMPVTVVDIVRKAGPSSFPGLYLHALPSRPWLESSSDDTSLSIVASTIWGSTYRVVRVSVGDCGSDIRLFGPKESKVSDVTPISPEKKLGTSVSVLDVCSAGLVLCVSSPVSPPHIAFCSKNSDGSLGLSLRSVSRLSSFAQTLESIAKPSQTMDLVLSPERGDDSVCSGVAANVFDESRHCVSSRFQVTLIVPAIANSTHKVPLIVYPHGGPHSSSLNSYSQGVIAMLASGLAVMHINFRGSLGFGEDSLESLPGRAGVQDVSEVLQAAQWALQSSSHASLLDKDRLGYVGGSHGGFLGAHCSVVAGTLFKRTALRNPVVNVSSMVHVTDIPDWAFCEAGVEVVSAKTGLALTADPPALERMWSMSPVSRVKKGGTTPGRTVLFVGAGDRRVPPEQSIEWQRLVTEAHGAGIVTLRWYPESGHAIDEVPNGDDVWVHTLELFKEL